MKPLAFLIAAGVATTTSALANDWLPAELPAYFYDVEYGAIGSDGLLYSMTSNANGYVLTSLADKFRYEPTGRFTGDIFSAKAIIYLGAGCDAQGDTLTGTWTKDGTGLNFAIDDGTGVARSFRVLSDGLSPSHRC